MRRTFAADTAPPSLIAYGHFENRRPVWIGATKMRNDIRQSEFGSARPLWRRGWDIASSLPAFAVLGLVVAVPHQVQARVFTCAAGDAVCLTNAIDVANGNGKKNTIRLAAGSYTLQAINNDTNGPNGLPSITSTLTIEGVSAGGTSLVRGSSAPGFRLIHVGRIGELTIQGMTLTGGGGLAGNRNGAGLFNDGGVVNISESIVSRNNGGNGGGVFNAGGVVNISGSIVSANGASSGGGLYNDDGTVTISSGLVADNFGLGTGGLFTRGSHSSVRITDTRFTGNSAFDVGGLAVEAGSVFVTRSTFDDNSAYGIGAIAAGVFPFSDNPVTLIISDSAFTDNHVGIVGGPAAGVGINFGLAVVTNTTFARNGPGPAASDSPAVFNAGRLILINSTVVGNGGGVHPIGGGLLTVDSPNTSSIVVNTILAHNHAGSLSQDCAGRVTSLGHNLIGTLAGCGINLQPSDLIGDPGLGAFTDNGLPGNGHFPLLPTSRAVDAGDDAACPQADQLGEKRKGACDIGAIGLRNKKQPKGKGVAPLEPDSTVSRTDGSDIVGDLRRTVTALTSPSIESGGSSRQLESLRALVGTLLSDASPIVP